MPAQKPPTEERDTAWHLDKKVNVSHIIATLMLAGAIFAWGSTIEQRISLVEQSAQRQEAVDVAQNAEARRYAREVREDIRELSRKIDKLIEGRSR